MYPSTKSLTKTSSWYQMMESATNPDPKVIVWPLTFTISIDVKMFIIDVLLLLLITDNPRLQLIGLLIGRDPTLKQLRLNSGKFHSFNIPVLAVWFPNTSLKSGSTGSCTWLTSHRQNYPNFLLSNSRHSKVTQFSKNSQLSTDYSILEKKVQRAPGWWAAEYSSRVVW